MDAQALDFTDGIRVRTDGPLRVIRLPDGWYVAGMGRLVPCKDRQDAKDYKKELMD